MRPGTQSYSRACLGWRFRHPQTSEAELGGRPPASPCCSISRRAQRAHGLQACKTRDKDRIAVASDTWCQLAWRRTWYSIDSRSTGATMVKLSIAAGFYAAGIRPLHSCRGGLAGCHCSHGREGWCPDCQDVDTHSQQSEQSCPSLQSVFLSQAALLCTTPLTLTSIDWGSKLKFNYVVNYLPKSNTPQSKHVNTSADLQMRGDCR